MMKLTLILAVIATAFALRGDNFDTPAINPLPAGKRGLDCPSVALPSVEHGCFWLPQRREDGCLASYTVRCDWDPKPTDCPNITREGVDISRGPDGSDGCGAWLTLHDDGGCVTGFQCDCPPTLGPPPSGDDCIWKAVENDAGCTVAWECHPEKKEESAEVVETVEIEEPETAEFSVLSKDAALPGPDARMKVGKGSGSQLLAIEETIREDGERTFIPVLLSRESVPPIPESIFVPKSVPPIPAAHFDAAHAFLQPLPPNIASKPSAQATGASSPSHIPTFGSLPPPPHTRQIQLPPITPVRRRPTQPILPIPSQPIPPPPTRLSASSFFSVLPGPSSRPLVRVLPLSAAPIETIPPPPSLSLPQALPSHFQIPPPPSSSLLIPHLPPLGPVHDPRVVIPPLPAPGGQALPLPLAPFPLSRGPAPGPLPLDIRGPVHRGVFRPPFGPLRPLGGPLRGPGPRPFPFPARRFPIRSPFRCPRPPPVPTQKNKDLICTPMRNRAGCIFDFNCIKKEEPVIICPSAPEKPRRSSNCNWVAILNADNCIVDYECEPKAPETCEDEPVRPDDTPFCKFTPIKSHIGCVLKYECEPNLPGLLLARRNLLPLLRGPVPARVLPLGGLPAGLRLGAAAPLLRQPLLPQGVARPLALPAALSALPGRPALPRPLSYPVPAPLPRPFPAAPLPAPFPQPLPAQRLPAPFPAQALPVSFPQAPLPASFPQAPFPAQALPAQPLPSFPVPLPQQFLPSAQPLGAPQFGAPLASVKAGSGSLFPSPPQVFQALNSQLAVSSASNERATVAQAQAAANAAFAQRVAEIKAEGSAAGALVDDSAAVAAANNAAAVAGASASDLAPIPALASFGPFNLKAKDEGERDLVLKTDNSQFSTPIVVKDSAPLCCYWAGMWKADESGNSANECEYNASYMKVNCQKSCGTPGCTAERFQQGLCGPAKPNVANCPYESHVINTGIRRN